jgi:hypothetical protein
MRFRRCQMIGVDAHSWQSSTVTFVEVMEKIY